MQRPGLLVIFAILLSVSGHCQQEAATSDTDGHRDSAGMGFLQRTATTLRSGVAIQDSVVTGSVRHPDGTTTSFVCKRSGQQFRYENTSSVGTEVFLSGPQGAAYMHSDGTVDTISGFRRLADFAPEAMSSELE